MFIVLFQSCLVPLWQFGLTFIKCCEVLWFVFQISLIEKFVFFLVLISPHFLRIFHPGAATISACHRQNYGYQTNTTMIASRRTIDLDTPSVLADFVCPFLTVVVVAFQRQWASSNKADHPDLCTSLRPIFWNHSGHFFGDIFPLFGYFPTRRCQTSSTITPDSFPHLTADILRQAPPTITARIIADDST